MARLFGAQRLVLKAIADAQGGPLDFVEDRRIARDTRIALEGVRNWFLTLDHDEFVDLALTEDGLSASITPKGRLTLELYGLIAVRPPQEIGRVRSRMRGGPGKALVVGVGNYPSPIRRLPAVANDVREMAKLLGAEGGGFSDRNVLCLADHEATRQHVLDGLDSTMSLTGPDDAVFAYFAGHGVVVEGEHYYVAYDTAPHSVATQGVRLSAIREAFDASPSRMALLLLDFCHGGGIVPRAFVLGEDESLVVDRTLRGERGQGKVIMAACASGQSSWEDPAIGHGVFTEALLRGLRGEAATQGEVTVNSLYDYVDRRVGSDRQRPMMFGRMEGRVVLARTS